MGYAAAENRSMMPQYIYPERKAEIVANVAAVGLNHESVHMENAANSMMRRGANPLVIVFESAPCDEALD